MHVLFFLIAATTTVFRDCRTCPAMVVVPAGEFIMGSPASEKSWAVTQGATPGSVADEAPQHKVKFPSFAIGEYDVTRAEYAAFVRESGYAPPAGCYESSMPHSPIRSDASWKAPGFEQSDRDPVVCVSWDDARAYVDWLNRKLSTPGRYRLPTEAEWEYAARGGTSTAFWWGNDAADAAKYAWFRDNAGGRTHPVGSKPANPFGLYDMAGNVWQWTADCYGDNYDVVTTAKDCLRVDRGGSWHFPAWLMRSATRERNPAGYRDTMMGFRVARSLP